MGSQTSPHRPSSLASLSPCHPSRERVFTCPGFPASSRYWFGFFPVTRTTLPLLFHSLPHKHKRTNPTVTMSRSRPNSRPVSRSNSISEAPITLPVDPRVQAISRPGQGEREASFTERASHWLKKDGNEAHEQHSGRRHGHHHNDQDPKLFVSTYYHT